MDTPFSSNLLVDRYRIDSKLGEGGMGSVYLAHDVRLETQVVVKVPHRTMIHEPGFKERFQREIRSLLRLRHPHIVSILDVGEDADLPFVVMQYLAGKSLSDHSAMVSKLSPTERVKSLRYWLTSIASALDFIHSKGYIHRDIKPANILFDDHGNAYLSDFGIAKVVEQSEAQKRQMSLTGTGIAMGTPEYMAPELCDGGAIDEKVDQYALAVTVYEMIAGKCPLIGPTPLATIIMHKTHEPLPLGSVVKDLPAGFSDRLMRGLGKSPASRYSSCVEFAQTLTRDEPPPIATSSEQRQPAPPPAVPLSTPSATPSIQKLPARQVPDTPSVAPNPAKPLPTANQPAEVVTANNDTTSPSTNDGLRREPCPRCSMVIKTPNDSKLIGRRAVCPRCRLTFVIKETGLQVVDSTAAGKTPDRLDPTSSRSNANPQSSGSNESQAPIGTSIPTVVSSPKTSLPPGAKSAPQTNPATYSSPASQPSSAIASSIPSPAVSTNASPSIESNSNQSPTDTLRTHVSDTAGIAVARPFVSASNQESVPAAVPANSPRKRRTGLVLLGLSAVAIPTLIAALIGWYWISSRSNQLRELETMATTWEDHLSNRDSTKKFLEANVPLHLDIWLSFAEDNEPHAQLLVADCYLEGIGVEKNPETAFRLFQSAADQGLLMARTQVAQAYIQGNGVSLDTDKGVGLLRELADEGHGYSIHLYARSMPGAVKSATAEEREAYLAMLRRGVEIGERNCQYELALCYVSGKGVARNATEAARLFELAATQGDRLAQYQLAQAYRIGSGVTASPETAFRWFLASAQQDHPSAQLMTGTFYQNGTGVEVNKAEAFRWFLRAAEQENEVAQHQVGLCYENGDGVTKSIPDAITWYEKADANGNLNSRVRLDALR